MKILHTSDWHLGQKFISKERIEEHEAALKWLLQVIDKQGVECLIVSGDIFDTFNPSSVAQNLYYDFLEDLRETNCKYTIIIGGNHDSPAMLNAPRRLLKSMNVHVVGATAVDDISDEIIELKNKEGKLELAVGAVPFLRDRDLVYATAGESGLERIQRIKKGIFDHYQTIGKALEKYKKSKVPIVATGHLYAYGAEATEKQANIYIGDKSNIKGSDFPKVFDYVALGHIHRPQKVGGLNHVRYSGSLIPLSFSEIKDEKLICLLDFEDNKLKKVEEIVVPLFRRLKTISGTVEKVRTRLKDFAEKHAQEMTPWVELVFEGEEIPPDLDTQIRAFAKDLPVDILKVRINRNFSKERAKEANVSLEDLDVLDVFRKKCERMQISKKEMKELEVSFKQLQESLQQKD